MSKRFQKKEIEEQKLKGTYTLSYNKKPHKITLEETDSIISIYS